MNPQAIFCPNPACPARGQGAKGNIGVHSLKKRRYKCHVCGKTFSQSKGMLFYRLRSNKELIVLVVTLLAYGCPVQAIVVAFGLDERTVQKWQGRSGQHCQQVHQHLVERPRDLGQVQADELWAKIQGGVLWLAMAIEVQSRLWLGGVLNPCREVSLFVSLIQQVRRCALCRPLLVCTDGYWAYVQAVRQVFREPIWTGRPGRPWLRPWDGLCLAQVVKQYARKQVVAVRRHLVQGGQAQLEQVLQQTQGGGQINTAYIERLNATFRSRLTALVRRGRALARQRTSLHQAVYLVGTVYNFCTYHHSLRVPLVLPNGQRRWLRRTPAIAAGLTDHLWTVEELLSFRVPPAPWQPPKRRGHPSKAIKTLVTLWAS